MKRVSIALTLGLSIAATQGCMTEPAETMDVGSAEQAMCESLSYAKVMAALLVAMSDEMGELHPTKYLTIVANKYGQGIDGVSLTSAATAKCASLGNGACPETQLIVDLQNISGIDPVVLNVPDYRSNLVSKLRDQQIWESSQTCLPPGHSLILAGSGDAACGTHYEFDVTFAGGFEVTREAESYNAYNRNGSQHNWTLSGGSMTIGPDWNHTWGSYSGSPNLSYSIAFPAAGNYKVWLRGMGANGNNDTAYVGINNTSNNAAVDLPENNQYGWAAGDISVPSAGTHNVQVFGREDGFFLDKLVVNQSSSAPGSSGSCAAPVPADLKKRIDRFQVNSSNYVGFSSDVNSIFLDPDEIVDPFGGGSGSGSNACTPLPPESGSDKLMLNYAQYPDKLYDCCWNNKVMKKYMPRQVVNNVPTYLACSTT